MVKGINEMHKKGWAHCDIKPSNMILNFENKVEIIDYDFVLRIPSKMKAKKGTKGYEAPELFELNGKKKLIDTSKLDVFALGATLLAMYFVDLPFNDNEYPQDLISGNPLKVERYCRESYEYLTEEFPKSLMTLLAYMLNENPMKRPSL